MIQATAIIPTYQRPQETARCLECLANSHGLGADFALETIIVDSSPDDCTWSATKSFARDLKLRYIKLDHQTPPGEARNLAVREASHELIISVDSDMELPPTTVWQMVSYLRDHPKVARMTGQSIFSAGPRSGQPDCPGPLDRLYQGDGATFSEGVYGRFEALYHTPFLELGGYDPCFVPCGEGTELSIRYWRAGLPLGFDARIIAYHNTAAPHGLTRAYPDRAACRQRTLMLLAYKYDIPSQPDSHFGEICREWFAGYGASALDTIVSGANFAGWFAENYPRLQQSKANAPRRFDFKPFDVFTDHALLAQCLQQAEESIRHVYQKAFMPATVSCFSLSSRCGKQSAKFTKPLPRLLVISFIQ